MDGSIVTTQVSAAAIVVWGIQALKTWKRFPWLQEQGQVWLKRGVSALGALGAHTSITHVWNPSPTVPGGHLLILAIPPATVIAEGLFHWFNQYLLQEVGYQGLQAVQILQCLAKLYPPPKEGQ